MSVLALMTPTRASPKAPEPDSCTLPWLSTSFVKEAAIALPEASEMPSETATTQRPYFS